MSKKRLLAMLMAGAMTLGVATGCGNTATNDSQNSDAGTDSTDGAYKIALIQQHQTNAFQIAVSEAAEAKAEEMGVELTILSADQDAATQISQIEQCVSEGYNAILFEPVDPDGLCDAAKSAADAGVVVINIISACTDWENYGISAVSYGDNVKAGETEMQHVADLLNGKGNIAILTGPSGDSGGLQRMEGYENVLKNYPDMVQVVAPADCQWILPARRQRWRAGCPHMIWMRSSARMTAWQLAQAMQLEQTAVLLLRVSMVRRTALKPSKMAVSPARFPRTAAQWLPTLSKPLLHCSTAVRWMRT